MSTSEPITVCRKSIAATFAFALVALVLQQSAALATDWARFRGPNGSGISPDATATPVTWSDTENLKWSVDLPGRGVSCPILFGDRVYITSWTGDGPDNLVRHLTCYDRATGKQIFDKSIPPVVKDEPYEGMFTQTGYTAHTPVTDGKNIYCFFGVSGVYAFDMEGNEIWNKSVGTNFDPRRWGTASSCVLAGDLVIVTAAAESRSIVALKKSNGEEVWKFNSDQLNGMWGTPVLVDLEGGKQELVFAVPGAVWAFDPATGTQLWTCKGADSNSACASAIVHDGIVYAIGGRDGGGLAIRAGGSGDVTESQVVWSSNLRGRIGTAVYDDGLIYWVADGTANCIEAETGEKVYQQRLKPQAEVAQVRSVFHFVADETPAATTEVAPPQPPAGANAAGAEQAAPGRGDGQGPGEGRGRGRGRGGRGGRGGGGFMQQDYASPVIADGKMYFTRRNGEVYVFALGREFKQLAVNKFEGEADYSSTPAVADGQIFLRSSKKLYCIAAE
jgi:outer membrane protein assembly factor BamB